jgi:uncharacterized pyridoxal phosphate-containing UPF0001 family protein
MANELARGAREAGRQMPVLVQVNVAADPSKSGYDPAALLRDAPSLVDIDGLLVEGLMTIGPPAPTPEDARATFAALRALRDQLAGLWPAESLRHLSMGMSADLEVAIEEGATIVRVGTALFGDHHAR